MMGVITGCVGGTIRDILAGVPSIIVRPEIYVTAAALASGLFLILLWLGAGTPVAAVTGAVAGFILRGAAFRWSFALPAYRDRSEEPSVWQACVGLCSSRWSAFQLKTNRKNKKLTN